jgi:hypothetical protein
MSGRVPHLRSGIVWHDTRGAHRCPCPLRVKTGHGAVVLRCPLYPRKQTSLHAFMRTRSSNVSPAVAPKELKRPRALRRYWSRRLSGDPTRSRTRQRHWFAQASVFEDSAPGIGRWSSRAVATQPERAAVEGKTIQRNVIDVTVREHGTNKIANRQRARVDLMIAEPKLGVVHP